MLIYIEENPYSDAGKSLLGQ